jgi:hypothetical protein
MNNNNINSGITEGFSKPRRKRITTTKWVNIKDVKPVRQFSVELILKNIYRELGMSSQEILTNKLKLIKNG